MIPKEFPFTVHPTRIKTLLLVVSGFVAIGIWMIRAGDARGWLAVGFFGLGVPIALLQFHPRCSYLTVDWDGIEYAALFRKIRIPWSDIGEFGVLVQRQSGIAVNRFVGINFSATYPKRGKAHAVARAISGFEGTLPDTYGFSAEELAKLLSACRAEMLANESNAESATAPDVCR